MIDNRITFTSVNLNDIRDAVHITNTSKYISLEVGHCAWYEAHNVPTNSGARVPINVTQGVYDALMVVNGPAVPNWIFNLNPNNHYYGNVYTVTSLAYDPSSGQRLLPIFGKMHFIGCGRARFSNSAVKNSNYPPITARLLITTYTNKKQFLMELAANGGISLSSTIWNDVRTPWTKFGTIWFSVSRVTRFNIIMFIKRLM